jgi:hypothetical protein
MRLRLAPFSLLFALGAAGSAAAEAPVAVSPGTPSSLSLIGGPCPTFSWSEVSGSEGYELIVYHWSGDGDELRPLLHERFAGTVYSWTPALDQCLERGGKYAWSVQAIGGTWRSEWSAPNLFGVAAVPGQMQIETAPPEAHGEAGEDGPGATTTASETGSEKAPAAVEPRTPSRTLESTAAPGRAETGSSALEAALGTALSVQGNIDATSFTGDGAGLTGIKVFRNTFIISSVGTPSEACDELRQVLASISPGGNAPARVLLDAELYDCGSNPVQLQRYTSLVGAGEDQTQIIGSVNSSAGLIQVTFNNLIEGLSVLNSLTGSGYSVAIGDQGITQTPDVRIRNVAATAIGGERTYGIRLDNTSTISCGTGLCPRYLTNVVATGNGASALNRGILLYGTSYDTTLDNVIATGSGGTSAIGLYVNDTKVSVRNSVLTGATNSIVEFGTSDVSVAHAQLDGGTVSGGNFTCFGAYDEAFAALDASCLSPPP